MKKLLLFAWAICIASLHAFAQTQKLSPENVTAWKFKTNGSVFASPAVRANTIYIGSLDSCLYALDANTGKEKWRFKAKHEVRSTATVSANAIFFESGDVLYALNHQGKLLWKKQLCESGTNQINPWDFYHASPTLHKGVVYIGTEKGLFLGFDEENGNETFRFQTEGKATLRATPTIANGTAFLADWDGVMHAIDLKSKKTKWRFDTRKDTAYSWQNAIQAAPTVWKDLVFFGGRSCRLHALDKKTGKHKWIYASPTNQWILGSPATSGAKVFIGSSDQRLLFAFDAESGKPIWETKMDSRTWGNILARKQKLYVGSRSFYKLDAETGKIESQVQFKQFHKDKNMGKYVDKRANIHSSAIAHGNTIIFGSDDGFVYAFDLTRL